MHQLSKSIYVNQLCGVLLYLFNFHKQIHCEVYKCCSIDSVVDLDTFSKSPSFSCKLKENRTWNAFNISNEFDSKCEPNNVTIIESDESFIELNGCIDKDVNNRFVALSCSQNTQKTSVHFLNKCCPVGQSYDHTGRFCTSDADSHRKFEKVLENSAVVFEYRVPDCSSDEVFVEYFSTSHNIEFVDKSVKVNDTILSPQKFCIEDLINVDSSEGGNRVEQEEHIIVRSCRPRSICNEISCIQRCCKTDQIMIRGPINERCKPHPKNMNIIPNFYFNMSRKGKITDYGVRQSWGCKRLVPLNSSDPNDVHYLLINGSIYMPNREPNYTEKYCIEALVQNTTKTFLCYTDIQHTQAEKFYYYPYLLSISCIFLAATLIVYLSMPKLLNLHGKTLVSYLTSFLAAYIALATIQFYGTKQPRFCYEIGYFLLYCLIATFCWQTMMCIDIWLTFGSFRSSLRNAPNHFKSKERKFLYYSAYAWNFPFIWTLMTMWIQKVKLLPDDWNPNIGIENCFFDSHHNWKNHFLFFILPAGLHVIVNCILFVITAINCSRVKADIHRMQCASDESNVSTKRNKFIISRAIFAMNLKLFTVMGISWVFEFLTTFNNYKTLEVIFDIYNLLLGVFMFIIFVIKRNVFQEYQRRFRWTTTAATTSID